MSSASSATLLSSLCLCASVVLFLPGCGEAKLNRATSQVNVLAETLSAKINEDGYFDRATNVDEIDPWDNRLTVKYDRKGVRETLTVRSNGPDGLPLTRDDIAARYNLDSDKAREARSKEREKSVENLSKAMSRGLTKGVVDSVKETIQRK